jgi:hypothetical protein
MKVVSAQRESACSSVSLPGGESGVSGKSRSRARAMQRVAVDVGADLQHRDAPVAAGELDVIGLGHHHRRRHRPPGQRLAAERQPDLLGIRRQVVVVEDDLVHGRESAGSRRPPLAKSGCDQPSSRLA